LMVKPMEGMSSCKFYRRFFQQYPAQLSADPC
jgi:hypothetical protein